MKMHKPSLWCVLSACIAALTLAGCGSKPPQTVKIAHLAPLTGAASSYGVHLINAAKVAVEEINAKGGVKLPDGSMAKIEYTEVDETSNSANAIEAVKKAISLEPVVMMGPNRSGGVLAAEKLWKEAKIATITDATNPTTTRQGNPYTFRMQISSEYWIPLLVKTAVEKYSIKKPAVIYGLNDYSKGNWSATEPGMAKYGLKPVTVQTFNDNDQDFSAQLLAIKSSGADAIFLYAYTPEVGKITRQRVELGMKDIPVFSERAASDPAAVNLAGQENFEGMVTSTTLCTGNPDSKIQEFIKKYTAKYGVPSATHLNHYDSVYIVADLVSKVGLDREKLRDALSKLDYHGLLGHYTADKEGNLVHHMNTQVWKAGSWACLDNETYPVEK
jgi:branched-chain amino acid transport system substrate-binding protein